jgi:hypothetical protein
MLRQLRSHSLPLQILLPFLAILPYLVFFFIKDIPYPEMHNAQGWFYNSWKNSLVDSPWLFMSIGWALNLVTAYTLNWINIRFEITGRRTVYVAYFYSLIAFTPLSYHIFQPAMLGGFLLLVSLIFIILVYHSKQSQAFLFNAGFFWGLASLVYPPFVALLPLYILSARYVKSTRFRDFVLLFTGFISPVWIWLSYQWLWGDIRFQWLSIGQWAEFRKTWPPELSGGNLLSYLFFAYLVIILLINMRLYRVKKDVGRRVVTIFGQLLWISPIIFLLFERVSVDILWITLIPSALLFSLADENSRSKWKTDLAFAGFMIFMILFQLNLILPN